MAEGDGAYVTLQMVEDFLSSARAVATFDDGNDGEMDPAATGRVIADMEATFDASIRALYEMPLVAPIDPIVPATVLQLIHCQAIKRFPEVYRGAEHVCDDAKTILDQIRKGELTLDHPLRAGSFEPSADSLEPRGYETLEPTP